MKKYFLSFGLLITVGVATVVFNSCGKDDDEGKGSLVGTWRLVEVNGKKDVKQYDFKFAENGDFSYKKSSSTGDFSSDGDTYTLKDNVIYFTYVPADEVIWGNTWKIVSLTSKELVADAVFNNKPSENARVKMEKIK